MRDIQQYIKKRKARDTEFRESFDTGYEQFKTGVLLKQAREKAGLAQEKLAVKSDTKNLLFRESKITQKISSSLLSKSLHTHLERIFGWKWPENSEQVN